MNVNVEDKALELIKASPGGVLQSDLWKDLKIDSRKCSRVVARLEADGKVKRTWETVNGTRTYRLSYLPPKKETPKKEYQFDLIMAEGEVAPCVGCTYECEPDYCPDLGNWIELLAKEETARIKKFGAREIREAPEEAAEKGGETTTTTTAAEEVAEKAAPKPAAKKTAKKPTPKPAAAKTTKKTAKKPTPKPVEKPTPKPVEKAAPKPAAKKTAKKPASKVGVKAAHKIASKTAGKAAQKPTIKSKSSPKTQKPKKQEKPKPPAKKAIKNRK